MEKRSDLFGRVPNIGEVIVWNPASYKGLIYGICRGFTKSGLPLIEVDNKIFKSYYGASIDLNGVECYSPKTGFVVRISEKDIILKDYLSKI